MRDAFPIADHLRGLQEKSDASPKQVRLMIENWAVQHDSLAANRLLQALVLKYAAAEKDLYRLNRELLAKQEKIDEDLVAAAEIQRSLLPRKPSDYGPLDMGWAFEPSAHIGGDIFNLIRLTDHLWAIYAMDVGGHGVPAAMMAVSVYQILQPTSGFVSKSEPGMVQGQAPRRPSEVLKALDAEYPFERFSNFFTMVYLVLDTEKQTLAYSNAGHPRPVILRRDGRFKLLKRGSPVIGLFGIRLPEADAGFMEEQIAFNPGDKLFLYTDGLNEYMNPEGEMYGNQRLHALLQDHAGESVSAIIAAVRASWLDFGRGVPPADDMTLVGIELKAQGLGQRA